jgi:hypothetical protein
MKHTNTAVTLVARILEVLDLYFCQDTGRLRIVVFISPSRQLRGYYTD